MLATLPTHQALESMIETLGISGGLCLQTPNLSVLSQKNDPLVGLMIAGRNHQLLRIVVRFLQMIVPRDLPHWMTDVILFLRLRVIVTGLSDPMNVVPYPHLPMTVL